MKFAFSTVANPSWDLSIVLAKAKEYGYDGVELRVDQNSPARGPIDLFADPPAVAAAFKAAGLPLACLATSVVCKTSTDDSIRQAEHLRQAIVTAQALGCPLVKLFDMAVRPGTPMGNAAAEFGDWLLPLADYAAEHDVTLVIENALSFRAARTLWNVLDRLNHPCLGVCWDILSATTIKESPAVSVPTLNSRIQYVHVSDAKFQDAHATFTQLGDGDVPVQKFLIRLKGIGYKGWVTVDYNRAAHPEIPAAETLLPEAIKRLRDWTKPQIDPNAKPARKAPAAAAAKPAAGAAGAAAKPAATGAAPAAARPATPAATNGAPAAPATNGAATPKPAAKPLNGDATPAPQPVANHSPALATESKPA